MSQDSSASSYNRLLALLTQLAAGHIDRTALASHLEDAGLRAALQALHGQTLMVGGDQITVGSLSDARGVAVGAGAFAIGDLVIHVHRTEVHGNQTNIGSGNAGPILSGIFNAPVILEAPPPPTAPPVFQVPHRPLGDAFVGRDSELERLAEILLAEQAAAIAPAVTGLGGIGKT